MERLHRTALIGATVLLTGCCLGRSSSHPPAPAATAPTPPVLASCPAAAPHVQAGYAALHGTPPQPTVAQAQYTQALQLHDGGCRLTEADLWSSLEGLALAHFQLGQYAAALPHLRRAAQVAPTIDETHYNLACALCRTGDTNGCYQELETTLANAAAGRPPAFMDASRMYSAAHYVRSSRTDPDLTALRGDARYAPLVARYAAVESPGRP